MLLLVCTCNDLLTRDQLSRDQLLKEQLFMKSTVISDLVCTHPCNFNLNYTCFHRFDSRPFQWNSTNFVLLSVRVQVGFYLGFAEYMLELSSESQADSQIKAKK